jgi:hypothetical protein
MFLSEARKYRVWFVGANQYLGQIPIELLQGLQNTMRISLRPEDDSLQMAQKIGKYDPDWDKREPEDEEARRRTNPLPYNVQEEYELLANEIKELFVGEGFIKLENRKEKFKALRFPDPTTPIRELTRLREWYAKRLMVPRSDAIQTVESRLTPVETTPAAPESQATAEGLPIKDYDLLNMGQISKRLGELSVEEIEQLRDYEAKNKNRRSLMTRFEKRIRTARNDDTTGKAKEAN